MKAAKKALTWMIILVSSFELAFAQTLTRLPSSYGSELSYSQLKSRMEKFQLSVLGKEEKVCGDVAQEVVEEKKEVEDEGPIDPFAAFFGADENLITDEENNQDYIKKLLEEIYQDPQGTYVLRHIEDQEDCEFKIKKGLIHQVIDEINEHFDEGNYDKFREALSSSDEKLRKLHKDAEYLLSEVRKYISDRDNDPIKRRDIIINYLHQVALPVRDYIVIRRSYVSPREYSGQHEILSLLPRDIPGDLFYEDAEQRYGNPLECEQKDKDCFWLLTMGPDPSTPNFLRATRVNHFIRMDYEESQVLVRDAITLMKAPAKQTYLQALKILTIQSAMSQMTVYDAMLGNTEPIKIPRSCQNHFNGDLQQIFDVKMKKEVSNAYLYKVLSDTGLVLTEDNQLLFKEYYIDRADLNPMESPYQGYLPFENIKNALVGLAWLQGLHGKKGLLDKATEASPFDFYPEINFESYSLSQDLRWFYEEFKVDFDDYEYFDMVTQQLKLPKAMEVFMAEDNGKKATYIGKDLFEELLSTPAEDDVYVIKGIDEEGQEYEDQKYASDINASTYIIKYMQRNGITDIEKVLPEKVKKQLQRTKISFEMPSLYGSPMWRDWALKELGDFADKNQSNEKVKETFARACWDYYSRSTVDENAGDNRMDTRKSSEFRMGDPICSDGKEINPDKAMEKVAKLLEDFRNQSSYLPLERLRESGLDRYYPYLKIVWDKLKERKLFPAIETNEYDYLMQQLLNGNPWARLRFGYLVMEHELVEQKEDLIDQFTRRTNEKDNHYRYVLSEREKKIKEAAKKLGIDRPLHPNYANSMLNREEMRFLWGTVVEDGNKSGQSLFSSKDKVGNNYFYYLDKISEQSMMSEEKVTKKVEEILPEGLSMEAWRELSDVLSGKAYDVADRLVADEEETEKRPATPGQWRTFLLKLYKMKGKTEEQKKLFEEFTTQFGFQSEEGVKEAFLHFADDIKTPIYKDILREAAKTRRKNLWYNMSKLCNLQERGYDKEEDRKDLRKLFYGVAKMQVQLNKMLGSNENTQKIEKVLDNIKEKIDDEGWEEMILAGGMVFAMVMTTVLASTIGGACTILSGGICAPVAIALVASALSTVALSLAMIVKEIERKETADDAELFLRQMEGLGFAERGSSHDVARTWFWTFFEVANLIPLVGIVSRGVSVGSRVLMTSSKTFVKYAGKHGVKMGLRAAGQSARIVNYEAELQLARHVLGFDGVLKEIKTIAKEIPEVTKKKVGAILENIKKLKVLLKERRISLTTFVRGLTRYIKEARHLLNVRNVDDYVAPMSKVAVNESVEEINKQTAKTLAKYYHHNSKGLFTLLESYNKKTVILNGKELKFFDYLIQVNEMAGKDYAKWYQLLKKANYKLRLKDFSKGAKSAKKIMADLSSGLKGQDFEDYILKNIEEFTDVFSRIPMQKINIPYVFLLQGGPHIGGPLAGRRIPVISKLADAIILRKMFSARSLLVRESAKSAARVRYGMPREVMIETGVQTFKAMRDSINETIGRSTLEEADVLSKKLLTFENKILVHVKKQAQENKAGWIKRIWNRFRGYKDIASLGDDQLREFLFNPQNPIDEVLAEKSWKQYRIIERFFKNKEAEELVHRMIEKHANYANLDEFEQLIKDFELLVLIRKPEVVEIM